MTAFPFLLLKWYYNKKKSLIFSLDFETMFTKHSPSEILKSNFEKKTVYLNYNFLIQWSAIIHQKRYHDIIYSQALECSVQAQLSNYAKHEFENLKARNSCAA